jgi:hypothetical protein
MRILISSFFKEMKKMQENQSLSLFLDVETNCGMRKLRKAMTPMEMS